MVRALRVCVAKLFRLYAGMNTSMDQICAGYADTELELLADFLRLTTHAGRSAAGALTASEDR